jgi:Tol biopolymer transport system component
MIPRRLAIAGLLALMVAFGAGVYFGLGRLQQAQAIRGSAKAPEKTHPRFTLPGTIVVAQGGTLYRLQNGVFKPIATGNWVQPAVTPDHQHLIVARREYNYSDLYLMGMDGHIEKQLTDNSSGMVQLNHWSLHPKIAPDGQTVYYEYDFKNCPIEGCYRVDFSVFGQVINGSQDQARRWTSPNPGTGGDIQSIPLASGGLIYTKFDINAQSQIFSQIWWQPSREREGHALTGADQSCYAPALSPDGSKLAMVCSPVGQANSTQLMVAPFDGQKLGPTTVAAQGFLNSPTWSPTGTGLLYLSPAAGPSGYFELYYLPLTSSATPTQHSPHKPSPAPTPPQPRQVTTENDFDPTASPIWF